MSKINVVFLISFLILASGCVNTLHRSQLAKQTVDSTPQMTAQLNQIADKASILTAKLKQQGVQVIQVGETISIIIPSDPLFQGDSANLNHHSFYALTLVADFLRLYSKTFVEVAGYTDYIDDPSFLKRNELLTSQQAAQVSKYLWSKGIDSRMLYAAGYGSSRPVSNATTMTGGNAENRRIEIHFQFNVNK